MMLWLGWIFWSGRWRNKFIKKDVYHHIKNYMNNIRLSLKIIENYV